ncbi:DUF1003 domain-containing protein [Mycolicibacterium brisbanense]|uniref:DUF1003 domain-containing protein n=1 Tax=Mycolicibacterium brisbanense TaxID=146020 RepID=A0A100W6S3_9MYCO|nr:DUF1003 domain-containing protein [Mycolicibacterium brisbanense]MCV7158049.1 DUF1003 domain-containing protein [Mycolicibacterium brisbanense]GAS92699.1 uncharacterized protein RMCB_6795 [Mycolicibacterium brisbanense]
MNLWHLHPGVRTGKALPIGDRAADWLRNGMGSWTFVLAAILGMSAWSLWDGPGGVDPFPYILLNLFLSMLAALQGAIILIAQKRADAVASEEAHHTLENTELLRALLEHNTELTRQVHELIHKPQDQR